VLHYIFFTIRPIHSSSGFCTGCIRHNLHCREFQLGRAGNGSYDWPGDGVTEAGARSGLQGVEQNATRSLPHIIPQVFAPLGVVR